MAPGFYQELYIGPSDSNTHSFFINTIDKSFVTYKKIPKNYQCIPVKNDFPSDSFKTIIKGKLCTIKRTDAAHGWGQNLRMILMREFNAVEIEKLVTVVIYNRNEQELCEQLIAEYLPGVKVINVGDKNASDIGKRTLLQKIMTEIQTPLVLNVHSASMFQKPININYVLNSLLQRSNIDCIIFDEMTDLPQKEKVPGCVDSSGYLRSAYSYQGSKNMIATREFHERVLMCTAEKLGKVDEICKSISESRQNWNIWYLV